MKHQEKLANADKCLANNIAFMRVTLWYLELCAATAEGDIGRVFEIIKVRSSLPVVGLSH